MCVVCVVYVDMVAAIMCGATKTLALGVPLLSVLYNGSPDLALLALPLIIYHAVQILQVRSTLYSTIHSYTRTHCSYRALPGALFPCAESRPLNTRTDGEQGWIMSHECNTIGAEGYSLVL